MTSVRLIRAMITLLLAAAVSATQPADTLAYTITWVRDGVPELAVELTFRTGPEGRSYLRLPSEWGGQAELYRVVHDLASPTPGVTLGDTDVPHVKWVAHPPGERVTVRYSVRQDFDAPLARDNYYRPVVQSDWFHAIGTTWIVRPDWDDDQPVTATFAWRGLGPGETVASSFGAGALVLSADVTPRVLRHAMYLGGDVRLHEAAVPGGRVAVALRGEWSFTDDGFVDLVRRVIAAVREFWSEEDVPYYLVSAIPNRSGLGGSRLNGAFGTFLGPDAAIDGALTQLLAHELMHEWIGGRLRAGGDAEAWMYWFTEGFTDFYTGRVMRESGLVDDVGYAGLVNAAIEEYLASPLAAAPLEVVVEQFWGDRYAGRLPYLRGHLFALEAEAALRRASAGRVSLDDVMRELLARAEGAALEVTDATVADALGAHLGSAAALDMIQRHVHRGAPFPLAEDLLGGCFQRRVETIPLFSLGFDAEASIRERSVMGVDPAGPAHAAGLRDGLPLLGWSVRWDDTSRPVVFVVEEGGGQRRIEFLPVGGRSVAVPRFVAAPGCVTRY